MASARAGTAGWSVPREHAAAFPSEGTHLQRYARTLNAVEINSSFYRPHRPGTYERWADSTPEGFRFAVKVPREITHQRRLHDAMGPLEEFLSQAGHLGEKLGPLLVQLPPSLKLDAAAASAFLAGLRERYAGPVALEPRHPTWFSGEGDQLLAEFRVARVAADPAVVPEAAEPGGWPGLAYYRWHGSPRTYYSPYEEADLQRLASAVNHQLASGSEVWCILDNTAAGEATVNALRLAELLETAS
ncbi:MAG TPA: DUF72 domain-containing protein [Deinococcales bacterium]|nr:DUF72 domain-containing protein [Deinococcales bacterium]